jgi:hypothetical protein
MARASTRRRSDGILEIVGRRTLPRKVLRATALLGAVALCGVLLALVTAYAAVGVPLLVGAAVLAAGARIGLRSPEPHAPPIRLRPGPDEGPTVATRRS